MYIYTYIIYAHIYTFTSTRSDRDIDRHGDRDRDGNIDKDRNIDKDGNTRTLLDAPYE